MSTPEDVVLRLSVPAAGDLRSIASELAVKMAEYLGTGSHDAAAVAGAVEQAARGVAAPGEEAEIEFMFRKVGQELLIEARSGGRTSELRHPLPA